MGLYLYDGSFEGLLSAVFCAFANKEIPTDIIEERHHQMALLDDSRKINTNEHQAQRVLKGVDSRTHGKAAAIIYKMFLSELAGVELTIFQLIKLIVSSCQGDALSNFANPYVLRAAKINKMLDREIHRMHAFVRFQKASSGVFYAAVDPDFNVLPLIGEHFEKRYADQSWIIFDTRRHYGLYFDRNTTEFIGGDHPALALSPDGAHADIIDEKEALYQSLWANYFKSVNIQERKNTKLHLRHMPKRYWKYLIEKQPG